MSGAGSAPLADAVVRDQLFYLFVLLEGPAAASPAEAAASTVAGPRRRAWRIELGAAHKRAPRNRPVFRLLWRAVGPQNVVRGLLQALQRMQERLLLPRRPGRRGGPDPERGAGRRAFRCPSH